MAPTAEAEQRGVDFTNMVIFCTKMASPLKFRDPTAGDCLNSPAREQFLHLRHEIPQAGFLSGDDAGILRSNDTSALARWHDQSTLGHWAIMRTAVPALVWERW